MRSPLVLAALTGVVAALSAAPAAAQAPNPQCHTDPFQGMTQPGGTTATMHVTADAPPCVVRVWTRLDPRTPYDRLDVASPPRFGTTTVDGSTFAYQPRPGYAGRDAFTVTGTGKTARGTPVDGLVRVTVEIAPRGR